MSRLDWWADVATVVSGAVTLLIALVGSTGVVAYLVNRYRFQQKNEAVEEYLRREKARGVDKGQRTATNIRLNVEKDLTEEEIYKIGRRNPRIRRRVRANQDGFAGVELYEYMVEEALTEE